MKKLNYINVIFTVFIIALTAGFNLYQDMPKDKDPYSSRPERVNDVDAKIKRATQNFDAGNHHVFGQAYFTDNFDSANDTTSLKSRGYKVYYRGTGLQGISPTWFQGTNVFQSYNGPSNGYLAANYLVVNGLNNIDSWLVLPKNNIAAGDSLVFYSRSKAGSPFPDSIRVMYSADGDSVPEALSWNELGRFKANTDDYWERRAFAAPTSGVNGRYAIRYCIADAGPASSNSDFIGIDALSIERPAINNDIAATGISDPPGYVYQPVNTIAPKAIFSNTGTFDQTNIPVTFRITGPVNYLSSKIIPVLNSGNSIEVTFDSSFTPLTGTYQASAYSSLSSDGFRQNDTANITVRIRDLNYGSGAGYYFANSTPEANSAPSHPLSFLKDTLCSFYLIVNRNNLQPANFTGSLDDGYFSLGNILNGKKIRFGGVMYDSVFISTNGIVGFKKNSSLTSYTPVTGSNVCPAFYPLWMDLNFNDPDVTGSGLSYSLSDNKYLVINYIKAPLLNSSPSSDEYVSFQVAIELAEPGSETDSKLSVQYSGVFNGTGIGFYNRYLNNTISPINAGLNVSTGNELVYRYSVENSIQVNGPLFADNPVTVEYGPDPAELKTLIGTGQFAAANNTILHGRVQEPDEFGANVYVSISDSFHVSKFDLDGNLVESQFITLNAHPLALECDWLGNLYISKSGGGVAKYDRSSGILSENFISGIQAVSINADPYNDSVLYISDTVTQKVIKYNSFTGNAVNSNFIADLKAYDLEIFEDYIYACTGPENELISYHKSNGDLISKTQISDSNRVKNIYSLFASGDSLLYFISTVDTLITVGDTTVKVAKQNLTGINANDPNFNQRVIPVVVVVCLKWTAIVGVVTYVGYLILGTTEAVIQTVKLTPKVAAMRKLENYMNEDGKFGIDYQYKSGECIPEIHRRNPGKRLELKVFVGGFYNPETDKMIPDFVKVNLRKSLPPYDIIDRAVGKVDENGNASLLFRNAVDGENYYLELIHKSSVDTWSAKPDSFSTGVMSYDFTDEKSKAYGNNQFKIDDSPERYGMYWGDINKDGFADVIDLVMVYNDNALFKQGYLNTDLNGDNYVDLIDVLFSYTAACNFIVEIHP